jgi:hypothetical protein
VGYFNPINLGLPNLTGAVKNFLLFQDIQACHSDMLHSPKALDVKVKTSGLNQAGRIGGSL